MLYGERDPSVRYIELLDLIRSDALHYAICEGADHHFAIIIFPALASSGIHNAG